MLLLRLCEPWVGSCGVVDWNKGYGFDTSVAAGEIRLAWIERCEFDK
jgi:hypothetical protein